MFVSKIRVGHVERRFIQVAALHKAASCIRMLVSRYIRTLQLRFQQNETKPKFFQFSRISPDVERTRHLTFRRFFRKCSIVPFPFTFFRDEVSAKNKLAKLYATELCNVNKYETEVIITNRATITVIHYTADVYILYAMYNS